MPIRILVLSIAIALALPNFALAAVRYPDAAPQGGKKRLHEGRALTKAEKTRLTAIIGCVKDVGVITKDLPGGGTQKFDLPGCAKCLEEMLMPTDPKRKPRICIETGTSTAMAATYSGKKKVGKCDPKLAQQNIQRNVLFGSKGVAVSTVVHEWLHMTQKDGTAGADLAADEAASYWLEVDVLTKLIADQQAIIDDAGSTAQEKADAQKEKKTLESEKKSVTKSYNDEQKTVTGAATGGTGRTSKSGKRKMRRDDGGTYEMFYDEPFFSAYSIAEGNDVTLEDIPLSAHGIDHPLNMLLLDDVTGPMGGDVVAVSGVDDPMGDDTGINGMILYFEIQDGGASMLPTAIALLGTHPASMAYQPSSNRLVVLDTLNDVIFEISGAPGVLPSMVNPTLWATAATFPDISTVYSLTIDTEVSGDDSVLAYESDYRVIGPRNFLRSVNLESTVYVVERQVGEVDSFILGESTFLLPGLPDLDTATVSLDVVGAPGETLNLRVTDASGALDGTVIASDVVGSDGSLTLAIEPQTSGTFVKLVDPNAPPAVIPDVVMVGARVPSATRFGLLVLIAAAVGIGRHYSGRRP